MIAHFSDFMHAMFITTTNTCTCMQFRVWVNFNFCDLIQYHIWTLCYIYMRAPVVNYTDSQLQQIIFYLPTTLIFLVPTKVPGSPLLRSRHSITNPFKLGFAAMLSVDEDGGHDPPMLLAALRYGPHVPLDTAHCAKAM